MRRRKGRGGKWKEKSTKAASVRLECYLFFSKARSRSATFFRSVSSSSEDAVLLIKSVAEKKRQRNNCMSRWRTQSHSHTNSLTPYLSAESAAPEGCASASFFFSSAIFALSSLETKQAVAAR